MKSLHVLASALLATVAYCLTPEQTVLGGSSLSVPGDNPLQYCTEPKDWVLAVDNVDVSPNPPQAGVTLNFTASGTFSQDIEAGAIVHLTVKYGVITIIKQTADLCDVVQQVDLSCPLEKGRMALAKSVDLPKQIPPGKYHVIADVETKDGDKITCLQATVEFARGSVKLW